MVFPKPDPEHDMRKFNLETQAHLFDPIGKLMNATDRDLTAFRARGGKLLMYFGWADPALNPLMGIEYYERVKEQMGAGLEEFSSCTCCLACFIAAVAWDRRVSIRWRK